MMSLFIREVSKGGEISMMLLVACIPPHSVGVGEPMIII